MALKFNLRFQNLAILSVVYMAFQIGGQVSISAQSQNGLLLTVNDSRDSVDVNHGDLICADANGRCSLRAAIEESNADLTPNAIIFDLPEPAVIDLSLGELSIVNNLEILGPGARRLTVRRSLAAGTPNFRIFHLPAGQRTLNIRGITIRNGNDNIGGGIFIEEGNIVALYDSAITENRANYGGGIANNGTLSILRCLINSNTSVNQGGGLTNSSPPSILTITCSTLTDNSASIGGAFDNVGTARLINDTISHNAAPTASSIVSVGTTKVLNTIIGRDIGLPGASIQGQFQSSGNNIVTNAQGSSGFVNGVNGDQVSTGNAIDPLLGSLADNGGQTDTLSLQPGSLAIDRGNDCVFNGQCSQLPEVSIRGSMDQRHYLRPTLGGHIDIGAFESGAIYLQGTGTISIGSIGGSPARYAYSLTMLVNPATLEKRYAILNLLGGAAFHGVPTADVYVLYVKAKRRGGFRPLVIALD